MFSSVIFSFLLFIVVDDLMIFPQFFVLFSVVDDNDTKRMDAASSGAFRFSYLKEVFHCRKLVIKHKLVQVLIAGNDAILFSWDGSHYFGLVLMAGSLNVSSSIYDQSLLENLAL